MTMGFRKLFYAHIAWVYVNAYIAGYLTAQSHNLVWWRKAFIPVLFIALVVWVSKSAAPNVVRKEAGG